ncbi:protein translocase subunit secY/sec61 alpha [Ruaniaceae bacterium KH17]|nr:protein translocase subunit secY/sec61 alpha [Ruaniaceae bacterium KH17]
MEETDLLKAFAQAFRTPDLRNKLLFTLAIMALFRLGSFIPAPGVSYKNVQACIASNNQSILDMVNLFSGGGLLQLSIFALGIMPYITSSIIMQLMRVAVPRLEELHKEGQAGQTKITQYSRYLTIGLAVLQSAVVVTMANTGQMFPGCGLDVIPESTPWVNLLIVLAMTAGTGLIMWLGELITEKGVGNGMSLLIFTSITASFPSQMISLAGGNNGALNFSLMMLLILAITLAVTFVELSQRRIPVQYAKRMVGRRLYGGSTTYIPLKINQSGVIPVIFASSLLQLPVLAAQFAPTASWSIWLQQHFIVNQGPWYMLTYALLILFFAFFYTSITFNPDEVADNMKKYGGFIPGIRAGKPTADYLRYVMNRLTTAGSIYLAVVALIPVLAIKAMGVSNTMAFGGTTLMIMVGVGLQTVREIDSQLQQRHYEGFLQ